MFSEEDRLFYSILFSFYPNIVIFHTKFFIRRQKHSKQILKFLIFKIKKRPEGVSSPNVFLMPKGFVLMCEERYDEGAVTL